MGVNELETGREDLRDFNRNTCSTPMGVNELETSIANCSGNLAGWCSTPMGVNELETDVDVTVQADLFGAQRLWALTN